MCVDWGVSIRKACGAICFDTSTCHYKSRRMDQAAVERRIREIAETRVRYGYRRVHVLPRREGRAKTDLEKEGFATKAMRLLRRRC